jgi:hypothetical protein
LRRDTAGRREIRRALKRYLAHGVLDLSLQLAGLGEGDFSWERISFSQLCLSRVSQTTKVKQTCKEAGTGLAAYQPFCPEQNAVSGCAGNRRLGFERSRLHIFPVGSL